MEQQRLTSTPRSRGERPSVRGSAAFYSLLSVMFINTMGFGIVVPLLPFYAQSFHAAAWQIALIFSAYSLGGFFGEPFWGRLSDRVGRKPILISTLLANCACYGALAFAPNVWIAFFIRLAGGMAAGNGAVVQGYLADVTPQDERAGQMSRLGAAYNIGFILGPFIGGMLAKPSAGHLGFEIPLLAASGFSFLSATGVFLIVRESRVRTAQSVQRTRWAMLGYAANHPVISRVILLTFAVGFAFTGIESIFGLWGQHRFDWGPRNVSWCFGIAGMVSAPTQFFLTGPLSRRFGEATMLAVGMAGMAIAIALQPFSDGGVSTITLMAVTALCSSVAFPNAGALLSRSTDDDNQGQVMGLNNAAGAFARVAGPFTAGLAFADSSVNAPFWLAAAITTPAILLALSAGRAAGSRNAEVRA